MTFCVTTRRIEIVLFFATLSGMYALQRKMASNVPFITVILRFVIFGQPQFLEIIPKGVAIGFAR
jgi:hypothetical protein